MATRDDRPTEQDAARVSPATAKSDEVRANGIANAGHGAPLMAASATASSHVPASSSSAAPPAGGSGPAPAGAVAANPSPVRFEPPPTVSALMMQNAHLRSTRIPLTVDPSLTPLCHMTRQAFFDALLHDQRAALEPDYRTAFKGAHDVVGRLLPYHVWQVRDQDILRVLGKGQESKQSIAEPKHEQQMAEDPQRERSKEADGRPEHTRSKKRRRRSAKTSIASHVDVFPSQEETDSIWNRYIGIRQRFTRLRTQLLSDEVSEAPAPFVRESCYHLDKLAYDYENEVTSEQQEEFRLVKEQAMAKGITWEALMRISAGLNLDDVPIFRPVHSSMQEPGHPYASPSSMGAPGILPTGPGDVQRDPRFMAMSNGDISMTDDGQRLFSPMDYSAPSTSSIPYTPMQPYTPAADSIGFKGLGHAPRFSESALSPMSPGTPTGTFAAYQNSSSPMHPQATAGGAPVRGGRRPRGRPRKQRDERGRIIRTPPREDGAPSTPRPTDEAKTMARAPAAASIATTPSSFNASQPGSHQPSPSAPQPQANTSQRPSGHASSAANSTSASHAARPNGGTGSTKSSAIPSHPIRLVLPMTSLPTLTSLGITPVPASHLVAAVNARQREAEDPASNSERIRAISRKFDTAPRPAPQRQAEPAMLMGITTNKYLRNSQKQQQKRKEQKEGEEDDEDDSDSDEEAPEQELLHISVVLSKFGSAQLSGLAKLMQELQAAGGVGGGGGASSSAGTANASSSSTSK